MSPLALSLHLLLTQPDSRLVDLARAGHEPAFEALVRRYNKELLAYCRRLQPRSGSAEDAVQQTFLQAWRALKAGAEVRDARPWLYRIAHNVTLNHLRVVVAVPQEIREAVSDADVHQLVEQRLQARGALAAMAALPAAQRDVFVSTTLDGASHQEVATALGLSSGAIRGLMYRARATVRAAAAALIPSPALHWAIHRTQTRTGGARTAVESLAGGGGAGLTAAIVKGGAVLSLAGAVAGAGGALLAATPGHHRHAEAGIRAALVRPDRHRSAVREAGGAVLAAEVERFAIGRRHDEGALNSRAAGTGDREHRSTGDGGGGSSGESTVNSDGGTEGGSDGGSTSGSGRDGGGDGTTSGSSSGGSPGGSGDSTSGSTPSGSGSGGGSSAGPIPETSGSDGGPSSGSTSGTSGSDGGSSGSSSGGSGSGSGDGSSSGSGATTPTLSTTR